MAKGKAAAAAATAAPAKVAAKSITIKKPDSSSGASGRVYLECHEGSSNKFYEMSLVGCAVHASWGAIGKASSTQVKDFATADEAAKHFAKTEAAKRKSGYCDASK